MSRLTPVPCARSRALRRAVLGAAAAVLMAAATLPATAYELERHRWEHRLLLLFAPDPARLGDARTAAALAEHAAGLAERHMRVFRVGRGAGRWAQRR